MSVVTQVFIIVALFTSPVFGEVMPNFGRTAAIDACMDKAVTCNLIAGGVVVVGNSDGILYSTARGTLNNRPDTPYLNERTMFDVASLTKVIATTPAVMKLVDEGKISLSDPVGRWFPEFRKSRQGDVTIQQLLTHTSGLADFNLGRGAGIKTAIKKAAASKGRQRPGSSFNYADINFIILGELVHRVSGKTLDNYCSDEIFRPLGVHHTMFLPPRTMSSAIAPTLGFTSGVVGDTNARRLGGVAGHAGVFTSGYDLARYARLILGGGVMDGKRILSERAVAQMTFPYSYCNGTVIRGLGWDIESPFSAPRGNFFSKTSFGHTGYSGSSIWIDPQRDLFVVLLTNRLNYYDTKSFNLLRSDVSTICAAIFRKTGSDQGLPPQGELAKMITDLLEERSRLVPASPPRVVRVASARSHKHVGTKSHVKNAKKAHKHVATKHHVKKVAKNHQKKNLARSRRA